MEQLKGFFFFFKKRPVASEFEVYLFSVVVEFGLMFFVEGWFLRVGGFEWVWVVWVFGCLWVFFKAELLFGEVLWVLSKGEGVLLWVGVCFLGRLWEVLLLFMWPGCVRGV